MPPLYFLGSRFCFIFLKIGILTRQQNFPNNDEEKIFKIVGHEEADIENNLLSYRSPVAKELIGKVKNDFVMVNTPKGEKSYEIKEILYE